MTFLRLTSVAPQHGPIFSCQRSDLRGLHWAGAFAYANQLIAKAGRSLAREVESITVVLSSYLYDSKANKFWYDEALSGEITVVLIVICSTRRLRLR